MTAYLALRDSISIAEALEIEAARCVIGDFLAEWNDFSSTYKPDTLAHSDTPTAATPDETKGEVASRVAARDRLIAARQRHRMAIAYASSGQAEPPGRLTHDAAQSIDAMITAHDETLNYLRGRLGD